MKYIIKIIQSLIISLVSILATGCDGNKNANTIIMGCSAEYPPFEFKIGGELMGFDVDLARLICEKLGYTLEIKDMDFNGLIAALNSGRVDFAMSGVTVTEERMKWVDFSQIYYEPKFAIIYRKDNPVEGKMMNGKKIGVQLGSTMEFYLKEKTNEIGGIEILSLNRNPELIQELKIGRIDAIIIEQSQAEHLVKANKELNYSVLNDSAGEGYAIAFPKGSELKVKFNKALDEIKSDGELESISKKWSL